MAREETKRALIVVRTYPTPARRGIEVSCTAAVTDGGEWLRLFPVPWRFLEEDQQFRRYQWVELTVTKATDPRPESYKLRQNGIRILSPPLSTARRWKERKRYVLPQVAHCLCCLKKECDEKGFPTLGVFRPRSIEGLDIDSESASWTPAQLAILRQGLLFKQSPITELEKIPFSFRYRFHCADETCPGHRLICTDWEMGQAYRKWRTDYGTQWEEKFRRRFEFEMIHERETHFYVGTVHAHPRTWIIVGLFYPPPPIEPQGLFDA